jgi:hypothetical protein
MALKKAGPKKLRPLDAEVFELAEKVALIFDRPYAAPLRTKLSELAVACRNRIGPHGPTDRWATTTKWTAFLLRMILTCPRILSRPPEFEWVIDDLEWILTRRSWDPKFERDFWEAVSWVKKVTRTGHPHDKGLDYFRFETVQGLMDVPVQLKGIATTSSKSEAVERAAVMEGKLLGTRPPHERVVYRSCEKVEKELKALTDLLTQESAMGLPSTAKRASRPTTLPKKRMTPATHRKPPKRT